MYLDSLIALIKIQEANDFLESIDEELVKKDEIQKEVTEPSTDQYDSMQN